MAGSIIAGVFEPTLLIVAAGALIWLALIHRSNARTLQSLNSQSQHLIHQVHKAQSLSTQLRSILDSADVPIVVSDQSGTIVQVNRAAQNILGSGRSLIGEYFDSLIPHQSIQEVERLARSGESGHALLSLPVGGDMRIFDVVADPIQSTQGAVCTFTDITELSKSATFKADFAANASHELRTPIASIIGAIETLQGPAKDDPAMSERLLTMIFSNATRLDLLVNDLLDLSKLESTTTPTVVTRIDLQDFLDRICQPFAPICQRRGLSIQTQIDDEVRIIESDESLLELILRNLIENATKFARDQTAITIQIRKEQVVVDPSFAPPEELQHASGIRIGVRDLGLGIPLAHQSRIFERFYQVDEARTGSSTRRGTGLGLAIVKHATKTLGGTVEVQSIHQQGTTMIVQLPKCAPQTS